MENLTDKQVAGAWRPMIVSTGSDASQLGFGQRTVPRGRTHLPAAHEQRADAVDSEEPLMRVLWRPIPRHKNPAHQHLITQESSDGARSKMYLLNHIARSFGAEDYEHIFWPDLTASTVNTIMAVLRDRGYKESTRNAYLAVIKGTSKEAWMLGQMELETYEKIKSVKRIKAQRITAGSSKDLKMLVDLIKCTREENKPTARRNALLLEMMVFTGIRRKEARGIMIPSHISYDRQDILIQGKGGKDRWARLPDTVWCNLIEYIQEERGAEPGALFCAYWNKRSTPRVSDQGLNVSNINRILDASLKLYIASREDDYKLSDNDLTPHDIRRSFATALHALGHSVREIQVILGHSSVQTTEGYLHDDKDSYREKASRTLDDWIAKLD